MSGCWTWRKVLRWSEESEYDGARRDRADSEGGATEGSARRVSLAKNKFRRVGGATVITSAWKSLPGAERVHRVYKVLDKVLTDEQKDRIFRVSVLTREEAKRLDLLAT